MCVHFKKGDNGFAYIQYIKAVNEIVKDLIMQCDRNNLQIEELPKRINKPDSAIPKIIDEYFWVTITRENKMKLPEFKIFK